jgi:carbon monoxide dehydrogenase subunit G
VWDGINDPAVLKACIPGCEQLDKTSPTEFVATAKLKIGPVSATFKGKVTLSEMEPPRRCVLTGEGQGGVAGFAKGGAEVLLTPEGDTTVLTYTAKASVGGKLAQIGQRLIDGAAKQIADDFFRRFVTKISPELAADPTTDEMVSLATPGIATAAAGVIAEPPAGQARSGLSPVVWVGGLIAVIAVLLLAFGTRP